MVFVCHPKFCINIVFSFSWDHFNSQEQLKTMLMQHFGVTNKEHDGMLWYFWSGQFELEFTSPYWHMQTLKIEYSPTKNLKTTLDSTWSKHVHTVPKSGQFHDRVTINVSLAKTDRLNCETTRRICRTSRMVVIQWYHLLQNFSKQQ